MRRRRCRPLPDLGRDHQRCDAATPEAVVHVLVQLMPEAKVGSADFAVDRLLAEYQNTLTTLWSFCHRAAMENLENLASTAPDKLVELAALHWFICAENISYDGILVDDAGLAKEDRPDFRLSIGDRIIGIEITLAQRPIADSRFSAHAIEAAQNKFARDIEQSIHPALPILVHLPFNDEIAVTPKEATDALSTIVDKINELGSGLISIQSQNKTVAASAIAER